MNINNINEIFNSKQRLDILSRHISTWAMGYIVDVSYINNTLVFSNLTSESVLRCSIISFLYDSDIKWMIKDDIREIILYLISKIDVCEDKKTIMIPIA